MLTKFPRISFLGKYNRMLNGIYSQDCCFYSSFSPALISSPSQWLLLWELRGRTSSIDASSTLATREGERGFAARGHTGTPHPHRCTGQSPAPASLWPQETADSPWARSRVVVCSRDTESKENYKTNRGRKKQTRRLHKFVFSKFISFSFNLVEKRPCGLHQKINLSILSSK